MLQKIFAFRKACHSIALLVSLPVALMATVVSAQQVNQEEICSPETEKPHSTRTELPQPKPSSVSAYSQLSKAETATKAGNYAQAEAIWRQAIKAGANHAFAYFQLGETLRLQRKFEEAIPTYRKAIEIDPTYSPACGGWAQAYQKSVKPYIAGMELYPSRGQESPYIGALV